MSAETIAMVFAVAMLALQVLLTTLGTIVFFMVKRIVANIDSLIEEDKEIKALVYQHREDALVKFHTLGIEIYKARERRQHERSHDSHHHGSGRDRDREGD